MSDRTELLALLQIEGLDVEQIRWLIEALGSSAAVFHASPGALVDQGIDPQLAQAITGVDEELLWSLEDQLIDYEDTAGARFVTQGDADYPANLRLIDEPPLFLWVHGRLEPEDTRAVAVIGSWRGSPRALDNARLIGLRLAEGRYTVVSGLSADVDRQALTGALEGGGRAIGVLAGGIEMVEPEAEKLAEHLSERGALLSGALRPLDYPSRARGGVRDEVIVGLGRAVVIVETKADGRGMEMAFRAAEAGRPVLAVQPQADVPEGNQQLIEMGATSVTHVRQLLEILEDIIDG